MICSLANSLWLSGCLAEWARFRRAMMRVRDEQEHVWRRLVAANAETEFGRQHRFGSLRSIRDFRDRVPLRSYDELRPWIDRAAAGTPNVLTRDPVRLLQPTSGSTGATKLIPYTAELQREFQRGIRPWIADLFLHEPDLMRGPAYWSVSPALTRPRRSAGGIPIGFDDDTAYVGGWQRRLVNAVMAAPASLQGETDIEEFRYRTLLCLIRRSDLRLISVWNPTFLTLLVDSIPEHGERLAGELDRRRAATLREALAAPSPQRHQILWPHLRVVSCWTDAHSTMAAAHLRELFPHTRIQSKGLIATEAFVSLPLEGGTALAVRSHFFEFIRGDAASLAHELEKGKTYRVVVSTAGGLYRYCLDDIVEVVGHIHRCPLIRFIARHGVVSDRVGEKLNEAHVAAVLGETFASHRMTPRFAMLAFDRTSYVLYIDSAESDDALEHLARKIETQLRQNFHYDYARLLGQLGPLRPFRVSRGAETYVETAVRAGQRAGDVKPTALDRRDGWSAIFRTSRSPHP